MTIVVTGAAGFIGSNIIKGLNQRGIRHILAVDDLTDGDKFRNLADLHIADYIDQAEFYPRLAQGDYGRMMQVYQANQQERANTENFLRQAAELTQQGQLQINAQQLAAAVAQQREMMDFYTFLEDRKSTRLNSSHT